MLKQKGGARRTAKVLLEIVMKDTLFLKFHVFITCQEYHYKSLYIALFVLVKLV